MMFNRLAMSILTGTFTPYYANRFQSPLFDIFSDLRQQGWIDHFYKIVDCRLTLPQVVVAHLHGFRIGPEPVHVHVGMAYDLDGLFLLG